MFAVLIGLIALSAPALAGPTDTIAQKNAWEERQGILDDKIAKVNSLCGSKLTADYDVSSYPEFDPLKDRTQSYCQQATDTLGPICATAAGKQAVQQLTAVSCRFSTRGTAVRLKGGTLMFGIDPDNSSITGDEPGSYSWKSAIEERL